jgi:ABC-type microcin C transport system duplicated ATPase subunit YejF
MADRITVMQPGRVVEEGTTDSIFDAPRSNYTRRRMNARLWT